MIENFKFFHKKKTHLYDLTWNETCSYHSLLWKLIYRTDFQRKVIYFTYRDKNEYIWNVAYEEKYISTIYWNFTLSDLSCVVPYFVYNDEKESHFVYLSMKYDIIRI